ncbi:hypothetical protein B0H16DRAFT_1474481 [Mycena metata]|uniref:Uncharacterized protein n=1 Tax=Mycena metata TaxID=1033252 RepID=A0AAD7HHJ7_9AGAR|nr:hypothetical protein B0H16DRAFT_1474481 [Mycena metata]
MRRRLGRNGEAQEDTAGVGSAVARAGVGSGQRVACGARMSAGGARIGGCRSGEEGHMVERSGGRRWGGTGRARRAGRGVGRGWKEEAVEWRRRAERIGREQEEGAGGRKRAVAGGGRVMVAGGRGD